MDGHYLSNPAKRPLDPPSVPNGASKRRPKTPPPPITATSSDAAFRLLCPSPLTGGVIGKSGSVISTLRHQTGAKIRVEDSVADCPDRVVLVVAPRFGAHPLPLDHGESRDVSPSQEALVRVFERVLELEAESETEGHPGTSVSCRLLAQVGQVGAVMGKGGKVIEKIRKESGAKIKVLPSEQLPACAMPDDEVIQINGDALAVKKALVSVSKCLQENPPADKAQSIGKPIGTGLRGSITNPHGSFPDPCSDHFFRSSYASPIHGSSLDHVARGRPLSPVKKPMSDEKMHQEVVFRLLCYNDKIGGVIGKGGTIINAIENETGSSISVGSTKGESEERIITVTAVESLESPHSPAQNAVARVFARSVESGFEKGLDSGLGKGTTITARLLVASNQVGCLMGKGGAIITEMRKATGAGIRILGNEQVPKCAAVNDEVVQITGEYAIVWDALFHITSRLRDNMLPTKSINDTGAGIYPSTIPESASYGRTREPTPPRSYSSLGLSHMLDHPTALAHSMDHVGPSHNIDYPSAQLWSSQAVGSENIRNIPDIGRGSASLKGCIELGSGSKTALVTSTTVEILVPSHVMGSVYGENGNNLSRMRQISGAKVVVHDPQPGIGEGTVIISGTPDQTQAAQSLLQAFILSRRSPDYHSRLL